MGDVWRAVCGVNELNSQLGVLLAEPLPADVRELLVVIQHELFNLGGELPIPGYELLKAKAVLLRSLWNNGLRHGKTPAQKNLGSDEPFGHARLRLSMNTLIGHLPLTSKGTS